MNNAPMAAIYFTTMPGEPPGSGNFRSEMSSEGICNARIPSENNGGVRRMYAARSDGKCSQSQARVVEQCKSYTDDFPCPLHRICRLKITDHQKCQVIEIHVVPCHDTILKRQMLVVLKHKQLKK